jgi:hypothetical protein
VTVLTLGLLVFIGLLLGVAGLLLCEAKRPDVGAHGTGPRPGASLLLALAVPATRPERCQPAATHAHRRTAHATGIRPGLSRRDSIAGVSLQPVPRPPLRISLSPFPACGSADRKMRLDRVGRVWDVADPRMRPVRHLSEPVDGRLLRSADWPNEPRASRRVLTRVAARPRRTRAGEQTRSSGPPARAERETTRSTRIRAGPAGLCPRAVYEKIASPGRRLACRT